jgi:hypothetical protein
MERQIEDGGLCECCGKRAGEEVHHVIHLTENNIDDTNITLNAENLRLLCKSCHHQVHNNVQKKYQKFFKLENGAYFDDEGKLCKQQVFIVYGSPMSGKTDYVKKNLKYGDFVFNLSEIFGVMSGGYGEDFPRAMLGNVFEIRDFAYEMVAKKKINAKTVWIISTLPNKKQREILAEKLEAELILIDTPKEVCIQNVDDSESIQDKSLYYEIIMRWFDSYEK